MEELLKAMIVGLVDDPDAIVVDGGETDEEGLTTYHIHVAPDDMGRVIGKEGRIAKAIRTVARAVANRKGLRVKVDID